MSYADPVVAPHEMGWKVEILHEGRSISRLWIVDRVLRIGAATFRTGGIAGVGTDHEHRKRGLAIRVLERSLQLMADEGYEASFLFGIQDFYHRVGFATCMPEHGLSLATIDAERATSKYRTRAMRRGDLARVRRIYEADNGRRTASVVRGRRWRGFPMGSGFGVPSSARIVSAPGNTASALGYVLYDDVADRCRLAEVGGAGDDVHGAILAFLARRAVTLRRERVTASVPADHPFAQYCRRFGARDETSYPRNAGPMGRVIDLPGFATAMAAEWSRRWPAAAGAELGLHTGLGSVSLRRSRDGQLQVGGEAVPAGRRLRIDDQAVLFQLAMGYRSAADAAGAGQLRGSKAALVLARELFPLRVAHMWWPDRF